MNDITYHFRTPSKEMQQRRALTIDTSIILEAAKEANVAFREVVGTECFRLEYQGNIQYLRWQVPVQTSAIGKIVTDRKDYTSAFLLEHDLSVSPFYTVFRDDHEAQWLEIFEALRKPLVIKPVKGTHGKGVRVDINAAEEFLEIVRKRFQEHPDEKVVHVEEMFQGGQEYRILATRNDVIGVIQRIPANVIGDGVHTIEQLLLEKNADPRRGEQVGKKALVVITIDDVMRQFLQKQGKDLSSVPTKGEQVFLRAVSNLAQGGDSIDQTDIIHPSVRDIALRCMRAIPDLAIAGIDFMTHDISVEQHNDAYVIIEVNSSPMLSMHDFPYQGQSRGAARAFLSLLFPELRG